MMNLFQADRRSVSYARHTHGIYTLLLASLSAVTVFVILSFRDVTSSTCSQSCRVISCHLTSLSVIERERSASRDRRASSVAGPSPYAQIDASLAAQLQEQTHCTFGCFSVEMSSSLARSSDAHLPLVLAGVLITDHLAVDKVEVSRLYEIYALLTDNGSTPIDKVRIGILTGVAICGSA